MHDELTNELMINEETQERINKTPDTESKKEKLLDRLAMGDEKFGKGKCRLEVYFKKMDHSVKWELTLNGFGAFHDFIEENFDPNLENEALRITKFTITGEV